MPLINEQAKCMRSQRGRDYFWLIGLGLSLVVSIAYSIGQGSVSITVSEIIGMLLGSEEAGLKKEIILNIRLPRALAGALTGGALALCGTVMQAVVRNPLADPYLAGVMSGASLGATLYLLLLGSAVAVGLAGSAFLGSLISTALVFGISINQQATVHRMLLAGIAVNVLCGSLASLIIYLNYNAQQLQTVIFWMMGSLVPASWDILALPALAVTVGCVFFCLQGRNLNLIMLGDEDAFSLGINPRKYRFLYLLVSALTVSTCVAFFGMIGFLGIAVPHIMRFLVSSNHVRLVPFTFLAGAIFMVWIDLAARTLSTSEIPLGVITGLVGSPFFFWLLLKPDRR